jgi:hypothetical protein
VAKWRPSSYVFLPLREGDSPLYRGYGNGLVPVLLVPCKMLRSQGSSGLSTSNGYECRDELDASWAVRPIALPYYHARWTLMLKAQGASLLIG